MYVHDLYIYVMCGDGQRWAEMGVKLMVVDLGKKAVSVSLPSSPFSR